MRKPAAMSAAAAEAIAERAGKDERRREAVEKVVVVVDDDVDERDDDNVAMEGLKKKSLTDNGIKANGGTMGNGGGGGDSIQNAEDKEKDEGEPDDQQLGHHQQQASPILEEIFYISSKRNTLYRVRLTERGLSLRKESSCGASKTETILVDDIVGCRCMRSKRRSSGSCACGPGASRGQPRLVESTEPVLPHDEYNSSAYLYIYAYVTKRAGGGGVGVGGGVSKMTQAAARVASGATTQGAARRRERMTVTLRFRSYDRYEDNLREASRWRLAIKCLIGRLPVPKAYMSPAHRNLQSLLNACPDTTKKLLVMLNPKSGPGRGRETFQRRVHPVLAEAELPYDVFITRHPNYARDFVRSRDLSPWSGIVLVGGDGIVFEALNGLLQRPDWEECLRQLPVAVIPCGSGNGLAKSIAFAKQEPYDQNPMLISALSVVRRKLGKMDLVRVETRKQTVFSFLSVGWGLLADIDIESERLRAIGAQRFTIWSMARLIGLRTYRGVVSYLPCDQYHNRHNNNNNYHHNHRDAAAAAAAAAASCNGHASGAASTLRSNGTSDSARIISHSKSCGDDLDRHSGEMRESRSCEDAFELRENGHAPRQRRWPRADEPSDAYADDYYHDDVDVDEDEDDGGGGGGRPTCPVITDDHLTLETESPGAASGRRRCDSFYSAKSRKSTYFSTGSGSVSSTYHSVEDVGSPSSTTDDSARNVVTYGPPSSIPALTAKVPKTWVKIEGEFVMVQTSYQSHIGQDCYFAPLAKLADGIIWLLIVRAGISRTNLLQFLLGLSTGTHLACPGVEMIPVRAFRIEPAEDTTGLLTVDGEKVDYGPLQGEIFPSLATVMCP